MRRYVGSGEVANGRAVVGVSPKILKGDEIKYWKRKNARTRTEYWRPALIQGDSVRLNDIVEGSSSVLSCIRVKRIKPMRRNAYEHKHCAILSGSTPILSGETAVTCPVRLGHVSKAHVERGEPTLIPHLKGETDFPTTGSWLIARISVFFKMPRMSGVIADSWYPKMNIVYQKRQDAR